jgi:hypothetical protein
MATPTSAVLTSTTDSFNDKVALAALVLGSGAFVIAFLQMVFQYITAGVREKCLAGAIGAWSKHTSTGWDFLRWRIRVEYVRLDLSIWSALEARKNDTEEDGIEAIKGISRYLRETRAGFRDASKLKKGSKLRWWHTWHQNTCLVRAKGEPVPISKLPFKLMMRVIWFLLTHPDRASRPARASWANMLSVLGIRCASSLILGTERADGIPSTLDNPLQHSSLHNI